MSFKNRVLIDADGCPVVRLCADLCQKMQIPLLIYCDMAHQFLDIYGQIITVGTGADAVDFAIVNAAQRGDILVTQDYALAAMALAKGCVCLNQNGMHYTDQNIDMLLQSRHLNQKIRAAGGRTKGPKKRTQSQNDAFVTAFSQLVQ